MRKTFAILILAAVMVAFPNATPDSYSVTTTSYQTFSTNTETSFSNSTTYETYNSTASSVLQSFVNPDWLGKVFVAVTIIFVKLPIRLAV